MIKNENANNCLSKFTSFTMRFSNHLGEKVSVMLTAMNRAFFGCGSQERGLLFVGNRGRMILYSLTYYL